MVEEGYYAAPKSMEKVGHCTVVHGPPFNSVSNIWLFVFYLR